MQQKQSLIPPTETTCDQENIVCPGRIQPFASLLVVDAETFQIKFASGNIERVLCCPLFRILGENLDDARFGSLKEALLVCRADPRAGGLHGVSAVSQPLFLAGNSYAVRVLNSRKNTIIEIEPTESQAASAEELMSILDTVHTSQPHNLFERFVTDFKSLTGFDRVMIYKFDPDWNGQVIASKSAPGLESYLGHWFPASDIPSQARRLYHSSPLRLIPDVLAPEVELVSHAASEDAHALDLTACVSRGVSPFHRIYLRNMQVEASMSVAILCDSLLWGIVTCQHTTPKYLNPHSRAAALCLTRALSQKILALELRKRIDDSRSFADLRQQLASYSPPSDGSWTLELEKERHRAEGTEAKEQKLRMLRYWVDCGGAAIVENVQVSKLGNETPTEEEILLIVEMIKSTAGQDHFATDTIVQFLEPMRHTGHRVAGVLAVALDNDFKDWVLWFRRATNDERIWRHQVPVTDKKRSALQPKRSFEAWRESTLFRAPPWTEEEISHCQEFRTYWNA